MNTILKCAYVVFIYVSDAYINARVFMYYSI